MHISLTDKLDEYIRQQIATGLYNNASEVVREALRLKIQMDQAEEAKLEALRRDIMSAVESADRGEFVEFNANEFIAELDAEADIDDGR